MFITDLVKGLSFIFDEQTFFKSLILKLFPFKSLQIFYGVGQLQYLRRVEPLIAQIPSQWSSTLKMTICPWKKNIFRVKLGLLSSEGVQ